MKIPGVHPRYKTRPDYIFDDRKGGYIVVECKGTIGRYRTAVSQLKRGTEQVRSLVFPPSKRTLTLVVGTGMRDYGTYVNIIDPPTSESQERTHSFIIENEAAFRQSVSELQLSALYQFVGAYGRAHEIDPIEQLSVDVMRLDPPSRVRFEELGDDYVGQTHRLTFSGAANRVSIFQGVPEEIYQWLTRRGMQQISELEDAQVAKAMLQMQASDQSRFDVGEGDVYLTSITDDVLRVDSFGRDGTVIRIEISS